MQNRTEYKGFGKDPYSNTGSDSQSRALSGVKGRIDWLQGTITYTESVILDEVCKAISERLHQPVLMESEKAIKFYKHSARWECGALLGWNEPEENKPGSIYVCLPAKALLQLEKHGEYLNLYLLLQLLDSVYQIKPTRIDVARDDYDMKFPFRKLEEALRIGNYAGFQNKRHTTDFKGGETFYLGSKESDTFARVYNKCAESKGLVPSHRFERVLKDTLAEQAFNQIMNVTPDDYDLVLSPILCSMAIGKAKFIDRSAKPNEKNLDRFQLLDWWHEYTIDATPIGYSRPKVIHSLDKKMSWINDSVARSMAMIKRVIGTGSFHRWIREQLEWADENLSREQENYVEAWLNNYSLQLCSR